VRDGNFFVLYCSTFRKVISVRVLATSVIELHIKVTCVFNARLLKRNCSAFAG